MYDASYFCPIDMSPTGAHPIFPQNEGCDATNVQKTNLRIWRIGFWRRQSVKNVEIRL